MNLTSSPDTNQIHAKCGFQASSYLDKRRLRTGITLLAYVNELNSKSLLYSVYTCFTQIYLSQRPAVEMRWQMYQHFPCGIGDQRRLELRLPYDGGNNQFLSSDTSGSYSYLSLRLLSCVGSKVFRGPWNYSLSAVASGSQYQTNTSNCWLSEVKGSPLNQ
jgi:hypothetical protein